jgi:hypothetical protein
MTSSFGDISTPIGVLPWSVTGIVIIVLLYVFTHPEKIDAWKSLLARGFSFAGDRFKRTAVSADIQSHINNFAATMNSESSGAIPYGVKIEWTKETSKEAFIQDGQVVVRMNRFTDQPKNMVYATMAYMSKGFLPHGRIYLDPMIATSADRIMTRKLLASRKLDDALQFYVSDVLEPELQADTVLRDHCAIFEKLDACGFLPAVFAREIEHLGLSKYPAVPNSSLLSETTDFVGFMEKVAEREHGEELPGGTQFLRANIKIAFALIAKTETLASMGMGPHLLWITGCWANGIDTVYVTARGNTQNTTARKIINRLEATGNIQRLAENIVTTYDPTGRPVECLIVALGKK